MAITLNKPRPSYQPTVVDGALVDSVELLTVPTSLREHAWTVTEQEPFGPLRLSWRTMGRFYPDGAAHTLVARMVRAGGEWRMEYGKVACTGTPVPAPVFPVRVRLECSRCGDRQLDADVEGAGVSLGAMCLYMDCEGVYLDA